MKVQQSILSGSFSYSMIKAVEGIVSSVSREVTGLKEQANALKSQVLTTDTKIDSAIEAKLLENLSKNAEAIKKELEPSWANVVAKAVDTKMEMVTGDVTRVQQTVRCKAPGR